MPSEMTSKVLVPVITKLDGEIFIPHKEASKQEELFRNILIGPISRVFEAAKIVLAGTFDALQVPPSDLQWSSNTDPDGNPQYLGVRSRDIRVGVVLDSGQGINMDVQRLGPARGRLREVTYWQYQVTYKGVVCCDHGTNVLYGAW
ncbi:uncharacterized protein LOC135474088 [Liolophura sinensis]|uniref:uncharacterized protein LOC135474088 n=1 Tax=Liolophura sinensis TaxID=3198878 RepID=UPI003158E20D